MRWFHLASRCGDSSKQRDGYEASLHTKAPTHGDCLVQSYSLESVACEQPASLLASLWT